MKTKYLLRGLGLGMIITAVVMGAYAKSAVAKARVDVLKEYGIGEEAALKETLVDVEKETVESSPAETQTQQEAPQQTRHMTRRLSRKSIQFLMRLRLSRKGYRVRFRMKKRSL